MIHVKRSTVLLFLVPALVLIAINNILPFLTVINYSFHHVSPGMPRLFVGLAGYQVASGAIGGALMRSLCFVAIVVSAELVLGLLVALSLRRARFLFPLIAFPLVVSGVAVGLSWRLFLREGGPLPSVLYAVFGTSPSFLGSPSGVFLSAVLMDIWRWTPLVILVASAALASMPKSPLLAADLDRLSLWTKFRKITLPYISYSLLLVAILRIVDAFKVFDEPWTMLGAGPGPAGGAEFVSTKIMLTSLHQFQFGIGSAMSVIVLVLNIGICYILVKLLLRSR